MTLISTVFSVLACLVFVAAAVHGFEERVQ